MAGYMLIERTMMKPYKADGVTPYSEQLGILDYLKELRQEQLPFAEGSQIQVTGLEDALLDAGANRSEVVEIMHRTMSDRANELWQRRCSVQVVFKWTLRFGNELWLQRGGFEEVSLRPLFGLVRRVHEGTNMFYVAGFNLT